VKLTAKTVLHKEIFAGDTSLGVFRETGSWNGFSELENIDTGETLIVSLPDGNPFLDAFNEVLGTGKEKPLHIIKASPGLAEKIRAASRVTDNRPTGHNPTPDDAGTVKPPPPPSPPPPRSVRGDTPRPDPHHKVE